MRHRGPVSVILAMRHLKFNLQMPQIELHHPSLVSRPLACDLHVRPCRGFTGLAQLGPRRVPWTRHLRHRGPTDLARQAAGLALGPANGSSTPWRNVPSHPRHRIIGSIPSANPWVACLRHPIIIHCPPLHGRLLVEPRLLRRTARPSRIGSGPSRGREGSLARTCTFQSAATPALTTITPASRISSFGTDPRRGKYLIEVPRGDL